MDLLDIHNAVKRDLGKERAGYFSPEEIDEALDRAQLQEFSYLIGDERSFQPGRPVSPVSYGTNRTIHAALSPFKEEFDTVSSAYDSSTAPYGTGSGYLVMPDNYEYLTGVSGLGADGSPIKFEIVNEEDLDSILDSELVAPTATRRVMLEGEGGTVNGQDIGTKRKFTVYPSSGFVARVFYLRRPATPAMSYTLSGRTFNYNAANSTQMEWRDVDIIRVIQRTVALLAKQLQEDAPYAREVQENRA